MIFYEVSPKVHPFFYWAEPEFLPKNYFGQIQRKSPPRNRPKYSIEHGRFRGHIIYDNVWSTELIDILKACQATGWGSYPVKVTCKGRPVDGYRGIFVSGCGGPLNAERSNVEFFQGKILHYDGTYMDESQWDGSDVFTIPEMGLAVYVVERVAKALMKIKLKNVSIVRHDQCKM